MILFSSLQYYTGRLVDENGVIYANGFYNYLTVWYNYDAISYTASYGNLHPAPPSWTPVGKADLDVTSKLMKWLKQQRFQ